LLHIARARSNLEDCRPEMPVICQLLRSVADVGRRFKFLDADISILDAGAHIRSHVGPHNRRLTVHLPLDVPQSPRSVIRVADSRTEFVDGEPFIFDDSFEHEAWNEGDAQRTVLMVTISHPDLASSHRDL